MFWNRVIYYDIISCIVGLDVLFEIVIDLSALNPAQTYMTYTYIHTYIYENKKEYINLYVYIHICIYIYIINFVCRLCVR